MHKWWAQMGQGLIMAQSLVQLHHDLGHTSTAVQALPASEANDPGRLNHTLQAERHDKACEQISI